MKKEFCIAAARLIYDIVGADGYVKNRELDIMDELLTPKYQLSDLEMYHEAMHHTFCDALFTVRTWKDQDDIDSLRADLELLAGVGEYGRGVRGITGFCSRKEAWLLTAFTYALRNDTQLFSYANNDFRFSRSEIIYLENTYNPAFNEELKAKHRLFQAQLNEFGLRLIYIPSIREYLKEKRRVRKLIKLMRYVNPFNKYEDADAQTIADDIDHIQTSDFARDFLSSSDIQSHEENIFETMRPSFLLKIGTSVVACRDSTIDHNKTQNDVCSSDAVMKGRRTRKADFILIPISGSDDLGDNPEGTKDLRGPVERTLNEAIAIYRGYTLEQGLPLKVLPNEPFVLHGFDRTFLNFAMNRMLTANRLTRITFDFCRYHKIGKNMTHFVKFTFNNERTIYKSLANKPMCLYLLTFLYSNQEKQIGVPYCQNMRKREVEKVLDLIGNKAKTRFKSMYQQDGTLALDLNHLHRKLEDLPAPYHVVKSNDGKHLIINFPYRDIVYINLHGQKCLLWDYIEAIRSKNGKMTMRAICEELFK